MGKLMITLALLIFSVEYADARSKEYLFGAEGVVLDCSAYKHKADGSWDVVSRNMVKGPWGTMILLPGAHFAAGQPVNIGGVRLLEVLAANCK